MNDNRSYSGGDPSPNNQKKKRIAVSGVLFAILGQIVLLFVAYIWVVILQIKISPLFVISVSIGETIIISTILGILYCFLARNKVKSKLQKLKIGRLSKDCKGKEFQDEESKKDKSQIKNHPLSPLSLQSESLRSSKGGASFEFYLEDLTPRSSELIRWDNFRKVHLYTIYSEDEEGHCTHSENLRFAVLQEPKSKHVPNFQSKFLHNIKKKIKRKNSLNTASESLCEEPIKKMKI